MRAINLTIWVRRHWPCPHPKTADIKVVVGYMRHDRRHFTFPLPAGFVKPFEKEKHRAIQ